MPTVVTCELCDTAIMFTEAGWKHLVGWAERGGCGLAEPPMEPLVYGEIPPLDCLPDMRPKSGPGCSGGGCASC